MEKHVSNPEEINRLFSMVRDYRNSETFLDVLKFCARFKYLSPYNAWLAQLQMPGARYLLTKREWKDRYGRKIKSNARPVIILVPFGPISPLFDIGDTYEAPNEEDLFGTGRTDEDILRDLEKPFKTDGHVNFDNFNRLLSNLKYSGIAIKTMNSAANLGAEIRLSNEEKLEIHTQYGVIERPCDFLISINDNADRSEYFSSLCHELGHLFCQHLYSPYANWSTRLIEHNAAEFEAETVKWLVCERMGLKTRSVEYLAGYAEHNILPPISTYHVFEAVTGIERMMKDSSGNALRRGLLWQYCPAFKHKVEELERKRKK